MKQGDPWRGQKPWQPRWERMWLRGRRNNNRFRSSWPVQISPSSAPPSNPPPAPRQACSSLPPCFKGTEGPSRLAPGCPSWEHSDQQEVRGQSDWAGNAQRALCLARVGTLLGYPTWEGEAHMVIFSWSFGLCLLSAFKVYPLFSLMSRKQQSRSIVFFYTGLETGVEWRCGTSFLITQ